MDAWKGNGLSSVLRYEWISGLIVLAVLLFFASSAQAGIVASEKVVIDQKKFDFKGTLYWDFNYEKGEMAPHLTGDLDLKDAGGQCGRMRMDFYADGHVSLVTKYGGEVCAKGDSKQTWTVDLQPHESNKVEEVKVAVEKKTASKDWTIVGSQTVKWYPVHDKVKITEDGFDFGGETFVAGAPTNSGDVAWTWKDGTVTPRVTGRIHINNAASACARLHIQYFTYEGPVADKYGGKLCASDNSHYYNDVDLSKYSDRKLTRITIHLQTLRSDGSWKTVGSAESGFVAACCKGCTCTTSTLKAGSLF